MPPSRRIAAERGNEGSGGRSGPGGWDGREVTAVAGTRMHAAVLGPASAPEVVCVHGLGCSHRYFLPLAGCLAPASRVVAVDLPGFGRTPGPGEPLDIRGLSLALAGWLRATGRGGVPLVANSVGCQVVVDMAVHAPDLLGPVVLVGPTMDDRARSAFRQGVRLAANTRFERAGLVPLLARDYLVCGPRRYFATLSAALADPVERKLRHVRTPTLVVRGARDLIAPREWARQVAGLLPRGDLAEVPDAGHTLNYSAPAELARAIRASHTVGGCF
ncbi:pimeloyl-ACP methyl ester carboxylesterase [Streptosporangium becharense]|uniref:Pimeloyl-ACP methyl ester carboxylesterase n=1 Tax=Streptosporangium becharense TaxID=1816182 RepID=A0A7W9ILB6_9ACTN|nr:alpha/beta hydrolase [Streptosporangium becharense]MBB2911476.1 pimeloyl-ACP methyl ester carboxylesterase [Streptosporangium becharense]MBB5822706.1 pimeloyl-ACP methyl ester carboxylesterase [Streptosporangium becharense]